MSPHRPDEEDHQPDAGGHADDLHADEPDQQAQRSGSVERAEHRYHACGTSPSSVFASTYFDRVKYAADTASNALNV